MSSSNPFAGYQNAFDNSLTTMAHSRDAVTTGNQFMKLTYNKLYAFSSVKLTLWRWDEWCQKNLKSCTGTYQRLGGLSIRVSNSSGDFAECGTLPTYIAPDLQADVVPTAIVKTVHCKPAAIGNRVNIYQTRTGVRLMISEVEIAGTSRTISFSHLKWSNKVITYEYYQILTTLKANPSIHFFLGI